MYAPDYSSDPGPKGEPSIDAARLAANTPHDPGAAEAFTGSLLDRGIKVEADLSKIVAQLPFKIRVIMKLAKAEFSVPTGMSHLSQPEEFFDLAKVLTLPGDPTRSPVLCVGGFGTTGQGSFSALAHFLNDGGRGPIVRVISLAGHTGSWTDLCSVTSGQMIDDVSKNARELYNLTGKPVVCVALSTGGLSLLGALKREPELFSDKNVGIGVPLALKSSTWNFALNLMDRWQQRSGRFDLINGFHIANPTVTNEEKAPICTRMPVPTLVQFHRLRLEVARDELLSGLSKNVLFLHGKEDGLADPEGARKQVDRAKNGRLSLDPVFEKAGHNLLLSGVYDAVCQRVLRLCAA